MTNQRKQIGKRIRQIRSGLGLTQKDFGEKLGVAISSISAYEKGETSPSFETVVKIAKLGQVGLDELLTGGDADAPSYPDMYDWARADENYQKPKKVSSLPEDLYRLSKLVKVILAGIETDKGQLGYLTLSEKRLLKAFRQLDKKRQSRLVDSAEDMALAHGSESGSSIHED
ncbi:MAG: helix-turn-helix domain-containing protein [Pedobacter sp.]